MIYVIIAIWLISGALIGYGAYMAFFWKEFPILQSREEWKENHRDFFKVLFWTNALLGPIITLICSLFIYDDLKHGFMFRYPNAR